ncbi:MAG: BrnT family toxin [Phycisphaerae bacterium]|nr:BrnT family toxin [Phycisphaerae bacterium]
MDEIEFSWDARKAKQNVKKHSVPFEKASTVFFDEKAIEFFDPDHSEGEDRFLMLGLGWRLRILVVCYCLRKSGSEIKIISARKATKKEMRLYAGSQK